MEIKINHSKWTIQEVETKHESLYSKNEWCRGKCFRPTYNIFIDKTYDTYSKQGTLLHELVHAFLGETQVSEKESFTEEEMCEFMCLYGREIVSIANEFYK